jgi:hypothetical protein
VVPAISNKLLKASDFQLTQRLTVTKHFLPSLTTKLCEFNKSLQTPDHATFQVEGLLTFSLALLLVTCAVLICFVCAFFSDHTEAL